MATPRQSSFCIANKSMFSWSNDMCQGRVKDDGRDIPDALDHELWSAMSHHSGQKTPLEVDMATPISFIVFGATGDLARKKLYPALYQLMFGSPDAPKVPQHAYVVGYG